MRTEKEIREKIKEVEERYHHVLTGSFATIQINSPRALMQISGTAFLEGLFFALGETRPKYEFEKETGK